MLDAHHAVRRSEADARCPQRVLRVRQLDDRAGCAATARARARTRVLQRGNPRAGCPVLNLVIHCRGRTQSHLTLGVPWFSTMFYAPGRVVKPPHSRVDLRITHLRHCRDPKETRCRPTRRAQPPVISPPRPARAAPGARGPRTPALREAPRRVRRARRGGGDMRILASWAVSRSQRRRSKLVVGSEHHGGAHPAYGDALAQRQGAVAGGGTESGRPLARRSTTAPRTGGRRLADGERPRRHTATLLASGKVPHRRRLDELGRDREHRAV